ncbi:MAG: flagellar hook-basal body complex protein FliE [Rhodospirillaceae bacterium]|nr:flagellar hook-basal body complex protein FliE [Rhodospirillaceae bacterium]
MDVKLADAISAYANAAKGADGKSPATAGDTAGEHKSFAQMVGDALEQVRDATAASETATVDAMKGKADLSEVVAAVTNAEVTLQGVVAVRDRVINAYQEILRMPI